ncbi:DsbA family protein [Salipaludibacillus sp. LMS25]|jgi:protein-disulfide isomerase|uniref:thioredoxin domain-containing protein n=1 Tax=Salipaludibacillus sp. LMS25 TaxID=2924031 RepID=UPI0020D034DC|nr:thioredoxin domain-containing protein [Salipaludibacillus sp. LMS25]UTR13235.1 DsbA family protein [Salipaludibacillus sp. LMS25]
MKKSFISHLFASIVGMIAVLLIVLSFVIVAFWSATDQDEPLLGEEEIEHTEPIVYQTADLIEDRIFLGEEQAENEVIFVLDYACPYCKDWVEDIYGQLKADYIDSGDVKFYILPQVYLSKESLALTEFTEKVAQRYPEHYFNVTTKIYDTFEEDNWGSEAYIESLAGEFDLNEWEEVELDYDVIRRTRQVTRGLDVEVVPSIYVNGYKVEDMMDYEEIKQLLEETERDKWRNNGESCGQNDDDC